MSGTQSNDYALEYVARTRSRQRNGRKHRGPSLKWLALVVVLLVTGLFVYSQLDLNLRAPSGAPNIIAEGGCLDFDMAPSEDESPTPLEEVVNDIRNQTGGIEKGDVRQAEYGYPQRDRGNIAGGGRTEHRTPVWAIVFEDEFDERTLSRLWTSREGERFTVLYRPDAQRITRSCGGERDSPGI